MSEETMKDLVQVEGTPAALSANFDEIRQALEQRLGRYDVIVTEDGVKDAKALATEINKLAQEIDQRRKDEVAKVSEPIREFDRQMKELRDLCKERRQKLLDQAQKFDDERRERCAELLESHIESLWVRDGVEARFRRAAVGDLAKLANLTDGGKLTKTAKDALENRARADRELQQTVKTRLLELEARSFRAGLAAPLTEDHVYRFLEADEETYEAELSRLMKAEVARQEEAERRTRERIEKEQTRQAPAATPPKCDGEHGGPPCDDPECWNDERSTGDGDDSHLSADEAVDTPAPAAPEIEAPDGKDALRVSCDFDITVASHVTDEQVEAELRRILTKAGITTLAAVRIHRISKTGVA